MIVKILNSYCIIYEILPRYLAGMKQYSPVFLPSLPVTILILIFNLG